MVVLTKKRNHSGSKSKSNSGYKTKKNFSSKNKSFSKFKKNGFKTKKIMRGGAKTKVKPEKVKPVNSGAPSWKLFSPSTWGKKKTKVTPVKPVYENVLPKTGFASAPVYENVFANKVFATSSFAKPVISQAPVNRSVKNRFFKFLRRNKPKSATVQLPNLYGSVRINPLYQNSSSFRSRTGSGSSFGSVGSVIKSHYSQPLAEDLKSELSLYESIRPGSSVKSSSSTYEDLGNVNPVNLKTGAPGLYERMILNPEYSNIQYPGGELQQLPKNTRPVYSVPNKEKLQLRSTEPVYAIVNKGEEEEPLPPLPTIQNTNPIKYNNTYNIMPKTPSNKLFISSPNINTGIQYSVPFKNNEPIITGQNTNSKGNKFVIVQNKIGESTTDPIEYRIPLNTTTSVVEA